MYVYAANEAALTFQGGKVPFLHPPLFGRPRTQYRRVTNGYFSGPKRFGMYFTRESRTRILSVREIETNAFR